MKWKRKEKITVEFILQLESDGSVEPGEGYKSIFTKIGT